jgi:hypothetical protein
MGKETGAHELIPYSALEKRNSQKSGKMHIIPRSLNLTPENWGTDKLRFVLRSPIGNSLKIRILRCLDSSHNEEIIEQYWRDGSPGIRRHVARLLGCCDDRYARDYLEKMLETEPVSIVMTELYNTAESKGLLSFAEQQISNHTSRTLTTSSGIRTPANITGTTKSELIALRGSAAFAEAASFRPIEHSDNLIHGVPTKGIEGDPRQIQSVLRALSSIETAPGVGFALRRVAATALGRFGSQQVSRHLIRALKREEFEHEGRPGAGMGIQYPVRIDIIHTIGELQCHAAVPALLRLLNEQQSSPKGGLHLPAMDALSKILQNKSKSSELKRSLDLVVSLARGGTDIEALNAVGVLIAANQRTSLTNLSTINSPAGLLAKKSVTNP